MEKFDVQSLINETEFSINEKTAFIPHGFVSHYTSPTGLVGIMESKKLRFTEYSCLNDEKEGRLIFDLCEDCVKRGYDQKFKIRIKERIVYDKAKENVASKLGVVGEKRYLWLTNSYKYFIGCFSTDQDNLSMWNYYTKTPNSVGYNIIFRAEEIWHNINKSDLTQEYNVNPSIYKVIYDEDKQLEIIQILVDATYEIWNKMPEDIDRRQAIDWLFDKLEELRFIFKHKAFAQEKEIRIVLKILTTDYHSMLLYDNGKEKIKLRQINGVFAPYMDYPFWKETVAEGVVVSPTLKDQQAKNSVHILAQKYGFNHFDIKSSEIPLKY